MSAGADLWTGDADATCAVCGRSIDDMRGAAAVVIHSLDHLRRARKISFLIHQRAGCADRLGIIWDYACVVQGTDFVPAGGLM